MATKKAKEIMKMSRQEMETKLKELKMELVKSSVNSSKSKNSRTGEIKKIIARILTLNK